MMTGKEALEKLREGHIVINGKLTEIKNTNVYYYINKYLTEFEELKRDVKRFIEIYFIPNSKATASDVIEYDDLLRKLSKVGETK